MDIKGFLKDFKRDFEGFSRISIGFKGYKIKGFKKILISKDFRI